MAPGLAFAKAAGDLKQALVSGGEQALHVQLGRGGQRPAFAAEGRDVLFGRHLSHTYGGVYLEESLPGEECPDDLQHQRPPLQIGPYPDEPRPLWRALLHWA